MNSTPRTSIAPPKETVSASIPKWKKRLLEAVQHQRGDRFISATLEHAVDELLRAHGLPTERAA
jgi:hypothetical protein